MAGNCDLHRTQFSLILKSLLFLSSLRYFLAVTEAESLFLCSQKSTTSFCSEPI